MNADISLAREILQSAATYIRRGHCQDASALNTLGRTTSPRDPRAVAWCLYGALEAAAYDAERAHVPESVDIFGVTRAMSIAVSAVAEQTGFASDAVSDETAINNWNDVLGRHPDEVEAAIASAIDILVWKSKLNIDDIMRAENLLELADLLEAASNLADAAGMTIHEFVHPINLDHVPTFGGEMPDPIAGVWSWDAEHVLVHDLVDWEIIDRADWEVIFAEGE